MTVAATLMMIINMTFRVPFAAYATLYAFNISREHPEDTVRAVTITVVAFAVSVSYILIGALFFLHDPNLRLFWMIATFFVMFFALSALANNTAAARFGYMVIITIPAWDRHIPVGDKVEQTLWAFWAISIASVIAAAVPLIYGEWKSRDRLLQPIADRLDAIRRLLDSYAAGTPPDEKTEKQIIDFALAGQSALRQTVQHAAHLPQYRDQAGTVVTLVGRLIDLAANMIALPISIVAHERSRIRSLAAGIGDIRSDLLAARIPHLALSPDTVTGHSGTLLDEMESTLALIPEAVAATLSRDSDVPRQPVRVSARSFFKPDAFTNPDHIRFGLKGCLAASLCYLFYSASAWPGINTAVTTCFLTALSTIGSSHQKQMVRISGAMVGAVVMGMGAQIFVLPHFDSIAGFTLVFVSATMVAAWCAAAGPRLSYFGVQIAIGFYLVNVAAFGIQASLLPGRDRIIGIVLGLTTMGLVFDHLWGKPAVVEMKKTFISSLRVLAEFAREPRSRDLERSYALRETITSTLDKVRVLADDVLLEFGRRHEQDVSVRNRIRQWEPQLRILFITTIATWKYRAKLPGFEIPESVAARQGTFDDTVAHSLEAMADRLEGRSFDTRSSVEEGYALLERAVQDAREVPARTQGAQESVRVPRFQTFLALHQNIHALVASLETEIGTAESPT